MTMDHEWAARVLARAMFVIRALGEDTGARALLVQELRELHAWIEAQPASEPARETAVHPCPECRGLGEIYAHVCGSPAGWRWLLCSLCDGEGLLTHEAAERLRRGQEQRRDRKRRGVTLKAEAERLGLSEAELSRMEWGRDKESAPWKSHDWTDGLPYH